jgi:hypothetical protein
MKNHMGGRCRPPGYVYPSFTPPKHLLVLISVRGWVNRRATLWLQGVRGLKHQLHSNWGLLPLLLPVGKLSFTSTRFLPQEGSTARLRSICSTALLTIPGRAGTGTRVYECQCCQINYCNSPDGITNTKIPYYYQIVFSYLVKCIN